MNQSKIVSLAFEALEKAVANAPYNYEIEKAVDELRDELRDLGVEVD